jgi:hypothetical protein
LTQLIRENPLVAGTGILGWGVLENAHSALLADLKGAVGRAPAMHWDFGFRSSRQINPFRFDWPTDIPLLPILAPALIDHFKKASDGYYGHDKDDIPISVAKALKAYELDIATLRRLARDESYSNSVRAGALALFWLTLSEPESELNRRNIVIAEEYALFAELSDVYTEQWLARSLIVGLLAAQSETSREALNVVAALMERCLDGRGPRPAVVELLDIWRERSTAPVHARQALQKWLGYSFSTPEHKRA